jgi:glutamine amidotransferase
LSKSIVLIPHGAGNISSLIDVFHQLGYFPEVAESASQIDNADLALIPGVGASGRVMAQLRKSGFDHALLGMHERQRPIIGICVGAQVMFGKLHENECTGLDLIPGEVARITGCEFNNGWSDIRLNDRNQESGIRKNKPLLLKTAAKTFYFNHGYQINTSATMQESASTSDDRNLLAYFVRDNLCGIQFHPEKSQVAGLSFIANTMKHYGF